MHKQVLSVAARTPVSVLNRAAVINLSGTWKPSAKSRKQPNSLFVPWRTETWEYCREGFGFSLGLWGFFGG